MGLTCWDKFFSWILVENGEVGVFLRCVGHVELCKLGMVPRIRWGFIYIPIQSLDEIISFSGRLRSVYKYDLQIRYKSLLEDMSHFNLPVLMEPVSNGLVSSASLSES